MASHASSTSKTFTAATVLLLVEAGELTLDQPIGELLPADLLAGLLEIDGHDGYGNSFMYYWLQKDLTLVGGLNQTDNDWWPLLEAVVEQTVFVDGFEDGNVGRWSSVVP